MCFLVAATPGPNMLLVMSTSARYGFRASVATMAGCLITLLAMMSLSAAGLGALLQTLPSVFNALRWCGAAYLAYLGIRSWRATGATGAADARGADQDAPAPPSAARSGALFRQGLLVAASNPKAILFAVAFLPQFMQPRLPKLPQFAILLPTFACIEISWYMVYAGGGQRLRGALRRDSVRKAFNRLTGGVFIGFAALVAAARA